MLPGECERSLILQEFKSEFTLVTAKAVSACLFGKVSKLRDAHRKAARRWAWVKEENDRRDAAMI